jgi:hypothetical protein
VSREETLLNVTQCVTKNAKSVLLTAIFAVILIYLFSICGFLFFQDDFIMEIDSKIVIVDEQAVSGNSNVTMLESLREQVQEDSRERACDTLIMCIITTLNNGLRNGGGIGDVLRKPSSSEPLYFMRVIYDLLFFFLIIIITLNLIFGVIIDTFGDLRQQKQEKDFILKNTCFICGLERKKFDNKTVSFDEHIKTEHNMWHYLYFFILLKVKNKTEFTGPESYVYNCVQTKSLNWFPKMKAMSLDNFGDDRSEDNDLNCIKANLEQTNGLVRNLTKEIDDIKKILKDTKYKQQLQREEDLGIIK